MATSNGNRILIYKDAILIGGQMSATVTQTRDVFETHIKGDDEKTFENGAATTTIDLDCLWIASDSGQAALQTSVRDGSTITVHRHVDGTTTESATAYVTSFSETFPNDEKATVAATLQISGAWSAT